MSTWIHITNLPLYYDDYGLQDIFSDIGQITATNVTKNNMIMKSTGFVQFANTKHAKLAASKKDQTVIANSAVRVYLLWTEKEDLSTIKVKNIEPQSTENDLEKYFDPYGGIVDIRIIDNNSSNNDDQKVTEIEDKSKEPSSSKEQEPYALISFCRVDYALQAVQEMNGTIIGMGGALSVELVNPDARNLKWKRNSFEYILMEIPKMNTMNQYHHNHHHKHRHRHHRHNHHNHHDRRNHHHNHGYNQQQYSSNHSNDNNSQTNPNIIIVNNIGSIHNNTTINDDDSKNNQLLHPTYRSQGGNRNDSHYRRHQNFNGDKQHHRPHSHSPNTTTNRGRGRSNNDRRYRQHHDNNDHHRHRRHHNNDHNDSNYQRNRHQRHDDKGRDRKARKYRSARSNQSTLLGPLHNFSNGQYRTYSVTPSPTRSDTTSSSNDSRQNSNNPHHNPGLQRMNSTDSTSSNGSTHSQPAYAHSSHYHQKHGHKRRALDHYGLHNNSTKTHHHSPQPFNPQQMIQPIQQQQGTPVSPATTVSTPSTTHSMPTPTGYTANGRSMMSRSKTPTALSIPLNTPTILSNSTTTPVSTPPSTQALKYGATNPVFRPQTSLPLNALNANVLNNVQMNNMNNMNNVNMMMNGMTLGINPMNPLNMNGMVSPTALSLPLQNMNLPTPTNATISNTQSMGPAKSPQAQVTSPIVITPQHNFLLQQQLGGIPQCNAPNAKTTPIIISPPNTQQPFSFGSPTLLGPLNTPPEPQKKFTFNGTNNNNTLSPASNNSTSSNSSSKKSKKSPSHSWTKEQEELGNKLYKIVASAYPERATKIVGMLLTGHNAEDLKFMVNRPNILMPLAKDYNEKQMAKDAKKEINK